MFTKEQVLIATLEYFGGDEMRTNIWMDKYALKDKDVFLEQSPDDMHKRLAKEFARIEQKYPNPLSYEEIFNLLHNFSFILPGGSILYGVGNSHAISSLGNCFVIGNDFDSYGGIFRTDEEQAQLMKRRAGVGHDMSHLRPALTPVTNAAGTSTGAVSFLERYSNTTREVGQNNRRGALMLIMNINHKDILEFITAKDDLTKITGANISVKISDEFMKTAKNNEIWKTLVHQAWKSAEPGVLFWDKIKSESIPSCYGKEWKETSTNPCGEIPLCPYDSCRLLSVNLFSFVDNPFTDISSFNYTRFKEVVYKAQRLMDDIVDLEEEKINLILNKIENDPEPEEIKSVEKNLWLKIRTKLLQGRRTGLSCIGLADCFAGLGYTYAEDISIALAEEIYKQFAISAYKSSIDMSGERGPFSIYDYHKEKENPFLKRLPDEIYKYSRRNIACLTIPPSGTISMMAGISSGIEPVYQLYYKRRYKILENTEEKKQYDFIDANGDKWREYIVVHPKFNEWLSIIGNYREYPKDLPENILKQRIEESPYYKSTAYEIDPIQRIKLQGAIQKWIDHSISSTINLAETVSESDVETIYFAAWKEGLKGVTIYRNNCRTGVLVDINAKETKRPKIMKCNIHNTKINGNNHMVLIGIKDNRPYEIFIKSYPFEKACVIDPEGEIIKLRSKQYILRTPSTEVDLTTDLPNDQALLTRLISTLLKKKDCNIEEIIDQVEKADGDLTTFGKAVCRILKRYVKDGTHAIELCPECHSKIIYENGCKICKQCGYSKCG
jgi:ribonucleoside-diphosphate reductase alpha chain